MGWNFLDLRSTKAKEPMRTRSGNCKTVEIRYVETPRKSVKRTVNINVIKMAKRTSFDVPASNALC